MLGLRFQVISSTNYLSIRTSNLARLIASTISGL